MSKLYNFYEKIAHWDYKTTHYKEGWKYYTQEEQFTLKRQIELLLLITPLLTLTTITKILNTFEKINNKLSIKKEVSIS